MQELSTEFIAGVIAIKGTCICVECQDDIKATDVAYVSNIDTPFIYCDHCSKEQVRRNV